jgi:integrase
VALTGVKTWQIRYVVEGVQKQLTLPKPFGISGEGFMSLADAKSMNAHIQALARSGIDFQQQKEEERQRKKAEADRKATESLTFKDLFDIWIVDGVNRSDGNKYIFRTFNKHALPSLGVIEIRHLSEHHLRAVYRSIIKAKKCATAVELSKDIGQMLRWAEKRKPWRALLVDGNPSELVEVEKLLPMDYTKERTRLLSVNEIIRLKEIFDTTAKIYENSTNKYGVERPLIVEAQLALWICLGTLSRIGELMMAEWRHVDFNDKTWTIPAANTKGQRGKKREQIVFLSDFTLDKFKQLHALSGSSRWVFPARYKDDHVCLKSVSKMVGDRQVKFKARTRKLKCRVENNTLVLSEVGEWTPHDLRRTGATMMQQLKISREVINLCQNHVVGSKVDRVYLLADYADEKREAWEKLGSKLDEILK